MPRKGLTFDDVVAMTAKRPDVEEYVWYRTRALRAGKLSFARLKEDGTSLVLLVDGDDAKEAVLAANPRVFFTTPHYDGYPYVLVRLGEAKRSDLAPLLESIWEIAARPKPPRGSSIKRGVAAKATKTAEPAKTAKSATAAKTGETAKVAKEQPPFARVHAIVARIPRGKVLTYGQISKAIDGRLTPVGVGWALRAVPEGALPWHRVVNAQGGISTDAEHHGLQRALLEAEGVAFGADLRVDLARYGWKVSPEPARTDRAARSRRPRA
jgi:methylated-DNA-protein-cysteine methyltransferase-like protein